LRDRSVSIGRCRRRDRRIENAVSSATKFGDVAGRNDEGRESFYTVQGEILCAVPSGRESREIHA